MDQGTGIPPGLPRTACDKTPHDASGPHEGLIIFSPGAPQVLPGISVPGPTATGPSPYLRLIPEMIAAPVQPVAFASPAEQLFAAYNKSSSATAALRVPSAPFSAQNFTNLAVAGGKFTSCSTGLLTILPKRPEATGLPHVLPSWLR